MIETDLGDELILLDPGTQQMFGLNAVGRAVWGALNEVPLDELVDGVVAAFDVARETADSDVRALLQDLLEAGLVTATAPGE